MADLVNAAATELHHQAFCLDAAAPLIEPRHLRNHFAALVSGGVDAVLATVASLESCRTAVEQLGHWLELERSQSFPICLATTVAAIRKAKHEGMTAIILHFQGANPIEMSVDLLNVYHQLGVRVMQLTYNARNFLGDGCLEPDAAGLSSFGRQALHRMGDLGMVVDLAHVGVRSSLEAIELVKGPVIVSHANARALCDSPRNLTDEQIRAVAASGGVIGLCAFPSFVSPVARPTIDHLLDHADYLCELVGPEHVGVGLDFADEDEDDYEYFGYDERYYPRPPWIYPEGIRSFADVPNIAIGLKERGYADEQIRGILGENFLRVFETVWGK